MGDQQTVELKIENISKCYENSKQALTDISLTMTAGVYALLVPNGVGKSTLMNILTDNLTPTAGSITWNGEDIHAMGSRYRRLLGFMPQQQSLFPDFTLERFMWYMAALKRLPKKDASTQIDMLLEKVHLSGERGKRLGGFSGGMKQRALIAQALLGDPKLIILDEPTAGLDPKERIRIRNLTAESAKDRIVIFATHVVSDIELIADQVLLLKQGQLLRHGRPDELCAELDGRVMTVTVPETELEALTAQYPVVQMHRAGGQISARILTASKPDIPCRMETPSLEDLYLYHFKEDSDAGAV